MSASKRAEVTVVAPSGVRYAFCLGTGALIVLQEQGIDPTWLVDTFNQGKLPLKELREYVKLACTSHPTPNDAEANDIIDDIGIDRTFELLSESFLKTLSQTAVKKGEVKSPPKPVALGTGSSRTPRRAAS